MVDLEKLALIKEKAENGDIEAQCDLALLYFDMGGKMLRVKAIDLLVKAADKGSARASFILGQCYEQGRGVKKNKDKALEYYSKSAELGFPQAILLAGKAESDPAKAFEWFSKGAELGDNDCMYELAMQYFHGNGVEQDYEKSKALFKKIGAIKLFNQMLPDDMKHLADNSEEEELEKTIIKMMESHNLKELLLQMQNKKYDGGWEIFDEMDDPNDIQYYDEDEENTYRLVRLGIIKGKLKYRKQLLVDNRDEWIPKNEGKKWTDFKEFRDGAFYTDSSFVEMLQGMEVIWEYTQNHPELLVLK